MPRVRCVSLWAESIDALSIVTNRMTNDFPVLVNRRTQFHSYPQLEMFLCAVNRRGSNGPTQHTRISTAPFTHQSQPHRDCWTRRRRSRANRDSVSSHTGSVGSLTRNTAGTPIDSSSLERCRNGKFGWIALEIVYRPQDGCGANQSRTACEGETDAVKSTGTRKMIADNRRTVSCRALPRR